MKRKRGWREPPLPVEEPAAPPRDWSWASMVQLEDFLLLGWLLAAEAVLLRWTDRSPVMWVEPGPGTFPWNVPWTAWLVIASLAFVVFSKGSSDRTLDGGIGRRILLFGPAYPLLSIIAMVVSLIRGGPRSARTHGGGEADWPMPSAPDWVRRTAAVPAILVGESGFRAILMQDLPRLLDTVTPGSAGYAEASAGARMLGFGFGILLLAIPFLFVVVGPRVAAGATADWRYWVVRFAVYAAAASAGSTSLSWAFGSG